MFDKRGFQSHLVVVYHDAELETVSVSLNGPSVPLPSDSTLFLFIRAMNCLRIGLVPPLGPPNISKFWSSVIGCPLCTVLAHNPSIQSNPLHNLHGFRNYIIQL